MAALVDPRLEVAKAARNVLSLDVPVFQSLKIATEEVGCLRGAIVASSLPGRLKVCEEALSLGLSVLVEPPMAEFLHQAAPLLLRMNPFSYHSSPFPHYFCHFFQGIPILHALWLRHSPPLRAIWRLLREGELGKPIGGLLVRLHEPGEETWPGTAQHLGVLLSLLGTPSSCRKERYALLLEFSEGMEVGIALGPSGEPMEGLLLACERGALLWDGRNSFVHKGRKGLKWRADDPLSFKWPERGKPKGKFEPLSPDPGPSGEEVVLARFRAAVEVGEGLDEFFEEGLSLLALLEACALAHQLGVRQSPMELMKKTLEGLADVGQKKGGGT